GGVGRFPGSGGFIGERSYYVRGRLVCGIQGAQGARVSLWENRGQGSPFIYEEAIVDAGGSFYVKAEIRNGMGFSGASSGGYLTLTITHSCQGQRQMSIELPETYFNPGIVPIKTYDLGTINLEGRFLGEGNNDFGGNSRLGRGGNHDFGRRFNPGGFGSGL
ncbi:unnamed protein product, partial [Cylicostephanus goldi]